MTSQSSRSERSVIENKVKAPTEESCVTPAAMSASCKKVASIKTISANESLKTTKEPEFLKTMRETESLKTIKEPESLTTMGTPDSLKAMIEPESLKTIREPESLSTMGSPDSLKAMIEPDSLKTMGEPESISVAAATKPESSNVVKSIDSSIPPLPVATKQSTKIPILDPVDVGSNKPVNVAVPKKLSSPARIGGKLLDVNQRPFVLTTHLVPSLPIGLFEIIAEIIEMATDKPVVLLHESRADRPVPDDIVDIAILPLSTEWKAGVLLPIGIVFAHRLNIHKTPGVYADIIVTKEIAQNVEDILDLRGHSCAIPDRHEQVGTAGLFFSYLKSKGENPSFFGNTLDSDTQLAALQMVAGKQAEVGVLEAPVINCHKHTLPGVNSLFILDSLGPLPPYQIMVNVGLSTKHREQIEQYLLKVQYLDEWVAKLKPYGILGFAAYSADNYDIEDIKSVVTSVRYY